MPEAERKATVYLPVTMMSAADLMLGRSSYETSAMFANCVALIGSPNCRLTTYYFHGGRRVGLHEETPTADEVYYLHGDHLGSASLVTKAGVAQSIESTLRYKPWGEQRLLTGLPRTQRRYTGQVDQNDAHVGSIIDYGARFYSPWMGRFVSADTIVPRPNRPQNLNRYSYVINSPLKYTDPTGHSQSCGDTSSCGGEESGLRFRARRWLKRATEDVKRFSKTMRSVDKVMFDWILGAGPKVERKFRIMGSDITYNANSLLGGIIANTDRQLWTTGSTVMFGVGAGGNVGAGYVGELGGESGVAFNWRSGELKRYTSGAGFIGGGPYAGGSAGWSVNMTIWGGASRLSQVAGPSYIAKGFANVEAIKGGGAYVGGARATTVDPISGQTPMALIGGVSGGYGLAVGGGILYNHPEALSPYIPPMNDTVFFDFELWPSE